MQNFRKKQEPAVDKLKEPILDEITGAIASRYKLNFTRQDTSSLWFLCKQVTISDPPFDCFSLDRTAYLVPNSRLVILSPFRTDHLAIFLRFSLYRRHHCWI